ncbi:MAG: hypothetical protein ACP5PT_00850 [Brevinematia bacterium]
MDDLEKLIKELEDSLKENKNQEQTQEKTQEKTQEQTQERTQEKQTQTASGNDERMQRWLDIGRQRFIALNASMPDFAKLYPYIEEYALRLLQEDYNKGNIKDDFLKYLEEGKVAVLQELTTLTKNTLNYIKDTKEIKPATKTTENLIPSYTMKDYENDYKKLLINSTAENTPLEFRDGYVNEQNRVVSIAVGELPIDQKANLNNL